MYKGLHNANCSDPEPPSECPLTFPTPIIAEVPPFLPRVPSWDWVFLLGSLVVGAWSYQYEYQYQSLHEQRSERICAES